MLSVLLFLLAFFLTLWLVRERRTLQRSRLLGGAVAVVVVFALALVFGPKALVLQKALGRLVMPLGLLWLALLVSSGWRFFRNDGPGAVRAFVAFAALGVVCNEYTAERGLRFIERDVAVDPLAQHVPFDAVIVLGGGVKRGPVDDSYELGPSGDRVALGLRLYRAGLTPLLFTTGSPIEGFAKPFDSVAATTTLWTQMGVPAEAIVGVAGARNTREEATLLAAEIQRRGLKRVGLVSSAWHLRRAQRLFERAGVSVVPLGADHRGDPVWSGAVSVVPTGNGAFLMHTLSWELLGAAIGR